MPDTPLEFGRSRHRENHVRQPEHSDIIGSTSPALS